MKTPGQCHFWFQMFIPYLFLRSAVSPVRLFERRQANISTGRWLTESNISKFGIPIEIWSLMSPGICCNSKSAPPPASPRSTNAWRRRTLCQVFLTCLLFNCSQGLASPRSTNSAAPGGAKHHSPSPELAGSRPGHRF